MIKFKLNFYWNFSHMFNWKWFEFNVATGNDLPPTWLVQIHRHEHGSFSVMQTPGQSPRLYDMQTVQIICGHRSFNKQKTLRPILSDEIGQTGNGWDEKMCECNYKQKYQPTSTFMLPISTFFTRFLELSSTFDSCRLIKRNHTTSVWRPRISTQNASRFLEIT